VKIGYFADGPWSHIALEKLVNDDRFEICFIVPRYDMQDSVLKEWAKKLSVDFLPIEKVNREQSIKMLKKYGADLFISMSFNQILKKEILQVAPLGFINCHAGKLPFYRGRNILNWVLINDEKEYGVTVHYVDEGIDTGDIIEQAVDAISDHDNYAMLLNRATQLCAEVLFKAVSKIEKGTVTREKQIEKHTVGFYCGYRREGDEWIDWNWSSRRIFNFIRSISKPAPCARTLYDGVQVMVEHAEMIETAPNYIDVPGTIVGKSGDSLIVKSGDSTIKLNSVCSTTYPHSENNKLFFRIGERFGVNHNILLAELLNRVNELEISLAKTRSQGE